MKIALCFSGQIRDFHLTRRSLRRHILSQLYKHEVFIFAHYPVEKSSNSRSIGLPVDDELAEDESFVACPEPAQAEHLIDQRTWHYGNSLRSFYLQLRSIALANRLRQKYEVKHGFSFDWIFRLRFDNLYFGEKLEDLAKCDPGSIYIPRHDNWWGYNDKFAFGGPAPMDAYTARFDEFVQYQEAGNPMHPEVFLKWVLDRHCVPVKRTRVANHLLRYGNLYRAISEDKYGDSMSPPRTWHGRLGGRLRVTRFSEYVDRLYLTKVRLLG